MAKPTTDYKPLPEEINVGATEAVPSVDVITTVEEAQAQLTSLRAKYAAANSRIGRYQQQVLELEQRAQKLGSSNEARQLMIFVAVLQGMGARGLFDPDKLKTAPGSERNLMAHAAGLAELANAAARTKGF
jgi:hypothetical protein